MTHRQALQSFPDTLCKNNTQLAYIIAVPADSREVIVALNFLSNGTVVSVRFSDTSIFDSKLLSPSCYSDGIQRCGQLVLLH
jgi:hypothetical protein